MRETTWRKLLREARGMNYPPDEGGESSAESIGFRYLCMRQGKSQMQTRLKLYDKEDNK